MKKSIVITTLLTIAAFAFVACQKEMDSQEQVPDGGLKELHFRVKSNLDQPTRTYITNDGAGNYTPYWRNGDELGAFLGTETLSGKSSVDMTLTNGASDGVTGDFEGTAVAAGNGTFQAFYPVSAFEKGYADSGDNKRLVGLNIGDKSNDYIQHPALSSPDPSCDVLISKTCDYMSDGSDVLIDDLFFGRPLSILKVNLVGTYAATEEVSWLKVTTSAGTLGGRVSVSLNTGAIKEWTVSKNYVWAEYTSSKPVINHATNNSVYFVVNPTTLANGTTLTVTAETENYSIEKSFTLTGAMEFPIGGISVLNLTIAESNCSPKSAFGLIEEADAIEDGGEYVFILPDGATPSTYYALHTYRTLEASGLTPSDDVISAPADKYIFIAEDGTESGTFALKNKSTGKYYPAASGTTTAASDDAVDIEITYLPDSQSYKIDLGSRVVTYYNTTEARFYAEGNFVDQIAGGKALVPQKSGAFKVYKKGYTPKTRLTTPSGLSVSGMVLSWSAVSGAVSYTVTIGETVIPAITETSYTFDGVADYYNVSVVAVADPSTNKNSLPGTLTDAKFGTPALVTPVLSAGGVTANSVTATWTDDPHATNGYHCEIYDGETKVNETDVDPGDESVTFSGLTEGTAYIVKVKAIAVTGEKAYVASGVASISLTPDGVHVEDITAVGSYTVEGLTVMAVSGDNVIAADVTGAILIYKKSHGLSVNDVVTVNGYTKLYHGVYEFYADGSHTLTINKTGTTTAAYPSPVSYTESKIISYALSPVIEYATAAGVADSGARTITVADGKVLNVYGDLSSYNGKSVIVNGYAFGYNSSKVDFMLVGAPVIDPTVSSLTTDPVNGSSLVWADDEYGAGEAKTISVTLNGAATGYTVSSSDAAWTISDNGSGTITVYPNAANASTTDDKTLDITITHKDNGLLTSTITLKQNKQAGGGGFTPFNVWEDSFSNCSSSSTALTSLSGSTTGFTSDYSGISTTYPMDGAIRIGKASGSGSITTPVLASISGASVSLTVSFKAAGWNGKTAKLTLSVNKGAVTEGQTTIDSESTMSGGTPTMTGKAYTFHITGADNTTKITFSTTNSIGIDDLVITQTSN